MSLDQFVAYTITLFGIMIILGQFHDGHDKEGQEHTKYDLGDTHFPMYDVVGTSHTIKRKKAKDSRGKRFGIHNLRVCLLADSWLATSMDPICDT